MGRTTLASPARHFWPLDYTCPMCKRVFLLQSRFVAHCGTHVVGASVVWPK